MSPQTTPCRLILALEKRFKSISHISVEHFAIASAGFLVLLASFAVQLKE